MNDLPLSALRECAERLCAKYGHATFVEANCVAYPKAELGHYSFRIHVTADRDGQNVSVNNMESLSGAEKAIDLKMADNSPESRAAKLNAQAAELQAQAAKLLEQSQIK